MLSGKGKKLLPVMEQKTKCVIKFHDNSENENGSDNGTGTFLEVIGSSTAVETFEMYLDSLHTS